MARPSNEFDENVSQKDVGDISVIQAVQEFRRVAEEAKRDRMWKNRENRDAFLGRQDFNYKQAGQSSEFLPKVPVSVEQMSAFIKRSLVQFGQWFSVDLDRSLYNVVTAQQVEAILSSFLANLWKNNNNTQNFVTVISDAVKTGMLESLIILKVHGGMVNRRQFKAEPGNVELTATDEVRRGEGKLLTETVSEWRLRIDLVKFEDYFPDPTGNGLYEIHRVERDLHEVVKMAEDGVYDMKIVKELIDTDYTRPMHDERQPDAMNQPDTGNPSFRKRVLIDEFWGTLLNSDGTIAHENIVCAVANDKYLIRPPEANPFWHQESPFIAEPLIRVPWSVWHKALYDHASALNFAINEMFNLMLDGGIASVWGIKQIRLEDLEDPSQVAGGVAQGATLAVKGTLPHGQKVMDTISEGQVPQDAMAMFDFLNREFATAALTSELKMGQMPGRRVLATEIVQQDTSQSATLDGLVSDLEVTIIAKTLQKAWLNILQNMDDIPEDVLDGLVDKRVALLMSRASPAERFALFAGRTKVKVSGISATMSKAKDFAKFMGMLQAVSTNPVLLASFMKRFSGDRTLDHLLRVLGLNPDNFYKDQDEMANSDKDMAAVQQAQGLIAGPAGSNSPDGGGSVPAEVNQQVNPMTGMSAVG